MNTTQSHNSNATTGGHTPGRFVIEYLSGNLRRYARDGRSLPVRAKNQEQAVVFVLGAHAESWDGNHFTLGRLRGRVEVMSS